MFHTVIRAAFVTGALFLQSANAPANDAIQRRLAHQAEELKPHILSGRATILTNNCPKGWLLKDGARACTLILRMMIKDFEDQGYFGRYICPPARTEYSKMCHQRFEFRLKPAV